MSNSPSFKAVNHQRLAALSYLDGCRVRETVDLSRAGGRALVMHRQNMQADHAATARAFLWELLGYLPWE